MKTDETRAPGWYFTYWAPGRMKETQGVSGPFASVEQADQERKRVKGDGYMTGQPFFVGLKVEN